MPVAFHTADIKFSLRNRIALRRFITHQSISSSNYRSVQLSFVFCSDEYLLNINRQFLQHDYYTDIITFPLSDNPEHLEAEIYISIDRVRENSEKFKDKTSPLLHSMEKGQGDEATELHRVMFHGVLHLLGFKDKTKANQLKMREMEDKWLKEFKLNH